MIDFWSLLLFLPFLFAIPKTEWHRQPDPLFEYYNTGDDGGTSFYGAVWYAQTFTVGASAHTITSVKLKMYRVGNPGTLTVSIRGTDGSGHPTGSDLTSGTIDANTFSTSPGAWYEIFLTSYNLLANTKYAIVCRALSGDGTNYVGWRMDSTSPTYTGGNYEESINSGSSWTSYASYDLMFEIWGNPPAGSSASGYGKYFPSGMRGQLDSIDVYIRNTGGSSQNLVLGFSVRPMSGELFEITNSIPAGFSGWWTVTGLARFWDYDSLFVYVKSTTGANIGLGMDTEATLGDCFSLISGSWQWVGYRPWIRANVKAQVHYPIPVEGQVSLIDIDKSLFSLAINLAPASGNLAAYQLINPSGSGKTLKVKAACLSSTLANMFIFIFDASPANLGSAQTPKNRNRSGEASVAQVRTSVNAGSVPAGPWLDFSFAANAAIVYNMDGIEILLDANHNLTVWCNAPAASVAITLIWEELPI